MNKTYNFKGVNRKLEYPKYYLYPPIYPAPYLTNLPLMEYTYSVL